MAGVFPVMTGPVMTGPVGSNYLINSHRSWQEQTPWQKKTPAMTRVELLQDITGSNSPTGHDYMINCLPRIITADRITLLRQGHKIAIKTPAMTGKSSCYDRKKLLPWQELLLWQEKTPAMTGAWYRDRLNLLYNYPGGRSFFLWQ